MNNLRGLLGIGTDRILNTLVRKFCCVKNGVDEKIDKKFCCSLGIIIIFFLGVSRSRQQSRQYIAAEDNAALKIRHKA